MAYATSDEVAAEFKAITFSSTSAVTTTDLARFIVEAEAEMDARLSLKYQVPVSAAGSLPILRTISIAMVHRRIWKIIKTKSNTPENNQGNAQVYEMSPERKLQDIVDGKLPLPGATLATSADGVRSYTSENSATVERTFKVDEDQW
jgi:hypothetical protein